MKFFTRMMVYLCSSPKLKNSNFGVIKVNKGQSGGLLSVFGL